MRPMELLDEKSADAATEKHMPVIEKIDGGYKVTVGSTLHPMEDRHYIEWIELLANAKAYQQFLEPGMPLKATITLFSSTSMSSMLPPCAHKAGLICSFTICWSIVSFEC